MKNRHAPLIEIRLAAGARGTAGGGTDPHARRAGRHATFSQAARAGESGLTMPMSGHNILVMTKRTVGVRYKERSGARHAGECLGAAEFKARCLELMDRVRETGAEYVVTKHGEPVAKLVPFKEPGRRSLFGSMKGTVLKYERPFDPIDGEYDVNRD